MSQIRQPPRRLLRRTITAGLAILGLAVLVVVGWLVWGLVRPSPAGYAPTDGPAVSAGAQRQTVLQYTIDATSRTHWAYFDFASGSVVTAAVDSLEWDLAFRRTDVLTNSGDTNPAGAGGAVDLGKVDLRDATVPAGGFLADAEDDEAEVENPALDGWYSYSWVSHVISSKDHAYAVRTATGEVALVTFLSYYCDEGSPGCITFQYTFPAGQSASR